MGLTGWQLFSFRGAMVFQFWECVCICGWIIGRVLLSAVIRCDTVVYEGTIKKGRETKRANSIYDCKQQLQIYGNYN